MIKRKIAFLTPGRFKPMGVFNETYINKLDNVICYFGGNIPIFEKGTSIKKQNIYRYLFSILSLKNDNILNSIYKKILLRKFKNKKIEFVLAEYLTTGASVIDLCIELDLTLISVVLGQEINKYHILNEYESLYSKLANYEKSYVVCVSKDMILKLEELGFKNLIYSPIGAKSYFFDLTPNYNSKNITAMGRFIEKKSPLDTIRAFKIINDKYPEYKLNFIGDGILLDDAKKLVNDLDLNGTVNFVGWISQKEQCDFFEDTLIFVQHSVKSKCGDSEGTPVVIIEALASAIPVVSTNHAGIPDVVLDNYNGYLVNEFDYIEMANKIIELIENKQRLIEFGENGRKFIKENFTEEAHIDTIKKIIYK